MKTKITQFIPVLFTLLIFSSLSFSQINITSGPEVSPEDMVQFFVGPGLMYGNVIYQGADSASGIFTNGSSTNIGIVEGIFLTSGAGYFIPGPNTSAGSSITNGLPGHPLLDSLVTSITYDASILGFDFIPMNDTVKCRYVFGSEEYSQYVNSIWNDVFGFFVNGPNPAGGNYENLNIAIVPGTLNTSVAINNVNNGYATWGASPTGPCTNCEFFIDNIGGLTIEYDGFTTVLTAWALVVPGELYNFTFGVADVSDHIYDSGVLLEGTSFKSPGPAEFFVFDFLQEQNANLPYDIMGEIEGTNVYLKVPEGTDLTNLIATWEEHGADVFVGNERQVSSVSENDYSEMLTFHLVGYETADWYVFVEVLTDIPEYLFSQVKVGPNPASGEINIEATRNLSVVVYNTLGRIVYENSLGELRISLSGLQPGFYFIKLEKDGQSEVRKVIVN